MTDVMVAVPVLPDALLMLFPFNMMRDSLKLSNEVKNEYFRYSCSGFS
jgi:hypothetical protein